jgi:hypothetical protein
LLRIGDCAVGAPTRRHAGFRDLTKEEAKAIDAKHLRRLHCRHLQPVPEAA